jgi:hypothetical protein
METAVVALIAAVTVPAVTIVVVTAAVAGKFTVPLTSSFAGGSRERCGA